MHHSVSESALRLRETYAEQLNAQDLNDLFNNLDLWVRSRAAHVKRCCSPADFDDISPESKRASSPFTFFGDEEIDKPDSAGQKDQDCSNSKGAKS